MQRREDDDRACDRREESSSWLRLRPEDDREEKRRGYGKSGNSPRDRVRLIPTTLELLKELPLARIYCRRTIGHARNVSSEA